MISNEEDLEDSWFAVCCQIVAVLSYYAMAAALAWKALTWLFAYAGARGR
jgi:hypothetical protein